MANALEKLTQEIARTEKYIRTLHTHVMTVVADGMSTTTEDEAKQKNITVSAIRTKLETNQKQVVDNAAAALVDTKGYLAALEAMVQKVTHEKSAEQSTLQAEIDRLRGEVNNSETYIKMYRQSHNAIETLAKSLTGLTAFGRDSAVAFGRVAPRFV
jgi:hypothetical protein